MEMLTKMHVITPPSQPYEHTNTERLVTQLVAYRYPSPIVSYQEGALTDYLSLVALNKISRKQVQNAG